jgi:hypothetical protein
VPKWPDERDKTLAEEHQGNTPSELRGRGKEVSKEVLNQGNFQTARGQPDTAESIFVRSSNTNICGQHHFKEIAKS